MLTSWDSLNTRVLWKFHAKMEAKLSWFDGKIISKLKHRCLENEFSQFFWKAVSYTELEEVNLQFLPLWHIAPMGREMVLIAMSLVQFWLLLHALEVWVLFCSLTSVRFSVTSRLGGCLYTAPCWTKPVIHLRFYLHLLLGSQFCSIILLLCWLCSSQPGLYHTDLQLWVTGLWHFPRVSPLHDRVSWQDSN